MVKGPLAIQASASRGGRRVIAALGRRSEAVLDGRTVARAARIVAEVRSGGDRALLRLARRHDGADAKAAGDLVLGGAPPGEAEEGADRAALPAGFAEALERAIAAAERFHAPQAPPARHGYRLAEDGVELEERVAPLARVGVYVPGGRASYPSTVVATVVPARLAGVREIVVATPPAAFRGSPALRHALRRLEVREVWGLGGAHAVAALAYGTATLQRVDKIVGPGNAWVTAAKRLVAGDVGIDGLAGPSEVIVVAGGAGADPALIAADLLAQAEHDPLATAVLITPERELAKRVAVEVARQLPALPTAATARAALARHGAALVVGGWEEAFALVERLAPEHLQLVGAEAEARADLVIAAGAVFVGAATPEVFGDYIAGPSHVLPTCGSARFASALGVEDFLRRSHCVRFTAAAAARWAAAAACLADAEGLPAHAAAARRRMG
ncbi:MAG TPA: histidinol dehydrogenase [Thermoanaerobaculia bacterium]|nr:histidinol dehydrogenase [Thermoanaerobaculia bacterium]